MDADPIAGLLYHWIGGLAAASFYIPYKLIRRWAWETYWLVGGFFAWIATPILLAGLLVPGLWDVLRASPPRAFGIAFGWGLVWGVGGVMYGLTMRYLGIALGVAIALGLCTAFGTIMPPLFAGQMDEILRETSGRVILLGVFICLCGIALSGLAGVSKERELGEVDKKQSVSEFRFGRGLLVAFLAGVMSAAFAYGLASGKPIADVAREALAREGRSDLWQNLPVLVVVLLGGFATNFLWCVGLNIRNRTGHQYVARRARYGDETSVEAVAPPAAASGPDDEDTDGGVATRRATAARPARRAAPVPASGSVPLFANYLFAAVAGVIWYLQFFFYSMGETRMGTEYAFSSWTLHMASIIIFSTLWGVALKELRGTSRRTRLLVALGLLVLVSSTVVVGYGNFLKAAQAGSVVATAEARR